MGKAVAVRLAEEGATVIAVDVNGDGAAATATEIGGELARLGPDTTGLREELRATLAETTDDLPW